MPPRQGEARKVSIRYPFLGLGPATAKATVISMRKTRKKSAFGGGGGGGGVGSE